MARLKRYLVTGAGSFPDDMLRYDCAKVVRAHVKCGGLCWSLIESERAPTIDRWRSFLWTVAEGKLSYPGNDPENGPARWVFKVAGEWKELG